MARATRPQEKGFEVELSGAIAQMVSLAAGNYAFVCEPFTSSVKVVAGPQSDLGLPPWVTRDYPQRSGHNRERGIPLEGAMFLGAVVASLTAGLVIRYSPIRRQGRCFASRGTKIYTKSLRVCP